MFRSIRFVIMRVCNHGISPFFPQVLDSMLLPEASSLFTALPYNNLDLICTNAMHLLHLPTAVVARSTYTQHLHASPIMSRLKRICDNNDLFDSEEEHEDIKEEVKEQPPSKTCQLKKGVRTQDDMYIGQTVDALAEFYDNISFTDSYLSANLEPLFGQCIKEQYYVSRGSIGPGIDDSLANFDSVVASEVATSAVTMTALGSIQKSRGVIDNVLSGCSSEVKEALTVPVDSEEEKQLHLESSLPLRSES